VRKGAYIPNGVKVPEKQQGFPATPLRPEFRHDSAAGAGMLEQPNFPALIPELPRKEIRQPINPGF
jgi:hypothetical protein